MARSSRLLTAYFVTAQVAMSYLALAVSKRFRSAEAIQRITREKHQRNARRIEAAIIRLRGLFIKVGQLISIMANFLPDEFREELRRLQDQVPPRPYGDIEARVREELGRGPKEVFAEFATEPVASASIGQVHVASLPSGERVAVKVQYPDIEETVRTDLRALKRIFGLLRWLMPDYGFSTIYAEIREMVLAELDFRLEAAAMQKIAANFAARPEVRLPRVMTAFSTGRVLTTEWIEGTNVGDVGRLDSAHIDRRQTARICVEAYCQQIFVDGLYHADPHPGNLLVQAPVVAGAPPTIVFLDFGATAKVSEAMRRGMLAFLQGAITRDTTRIVGAMKDMGFISRRADPEVFDRVVEYFHDKMRAQLSIEGWSLKDFRFDPEQSLSSLLDLRELNVSLADLRDAFHIPKEWILLERTLLLLLGVCTTLDPEMNPAQVIFPYLERFLLGEKKQWSELVVESSREMALSALSLPGELQRLVDRAVRGDLEIKFRNLESNARLLYHGGQQLLWGMLTGTASVLAVVFDGRGQARARTASVGAGVLCALMLFLSWLAGRSVARRR